MYFVPIKLYQTLVLFDILSWVLRFRNAQSLMHTMYEVGRMMKATMDTVNARNLLTS